VPRIGQAQIVIIGLLILVVQRIFRLRLVV
jgi:hypothetical protein